MIRIDGLNHHYGTGEQRRQILFDVCVRIDAQMAILKGPSGSGKSTLLTLLGALRSVQEGRLSVGGRELFGASREDLVEVRRSIGFIFQQHNLLESLTVAQNVGVARALGNRRRGDGGDPIGAMLERVGLSGLEDSYPSQLSGGQRQRVAIARALINEPCVILADEPTASLDRTSGRAAMELIREMVLERGCTALIVTHDDRILDLADKLYRIEDGRLTGEPRDLISSGAASEAA